LASPPPNLPDVRNLSSERTPAGHAWSEGRCLKRCLTLSHLPPKIPLRHFQRISKFPFVSFYSWRISMEIEERIPARDVARMIGVKTATLGKWRRLGKGPKGWREIPLTPRSTP